MKYAKHSPYKYLDLNQQDDNNKENDKYVKTMKKENYHNELGFLN